MLLIVTFFAIQQYQNHLYFTDTYKKSHIKQSLFELGHEKIIENIKDHPDQGLSPSYEYITPQGKAVATCIKEKVNVYQCQWNLQDNEGGSEKVIRYYYTTNE